jgi:hypothetical protein
MERLDSLRALIQEPEFLEGKGLSNEVNIRIFCYDPKDEMAVRHFTEKLMTDQSLNCHLIEYNLYKVFLSKVVGKYRVITLCGSTRFKEAFLETQKYLTLEGNIVISVGLFGHSGNDEVWNEGMKEMLDDMHKRKIDMADEIFVINVGGYIGDSTRSEIEYAKATGKTVRYLEP